MTAMTVGKAFLAHGIAKLNESSDRNNTLYFFGVGSSIFSAAVFV
jgi:hypothetical protein